MPIFQSLPDLLLLRIFSNLSAHDIERCQEVCRRFHEVIRQSRGRLRKFDHVGISIVFSPVMINFLPKDDTYRRAVILEIAQGKPTGIELTDEIWVVEEKEERPDSWSKQGLCWFEGDFTGRSLRLTTTLNRGQVIRSLVDKLKDRFIFNSLRVDSFLGPEVDEFFLPKDTGPIWTALTALPCIEKLHLAPYPFLDSYVFPEDFLKSKQLRRLKGFSIIGAARRMTFNDEDFLATKWEEADLYVSPQQITMKGMKKFLDEWRISNRTIKSISLRVDKANQDETKNEALARLHVCVECDEHDHWTVNSKGELLILEVGNLGGSYWHLEVNLGRYAHNR